MTPEGKRPSYVATANLIGGITAFIAPLIGGYFAMKYSLRPMMLISAVGRFVTGYLLLRFIPNTREVAQDEGGLAAPTNS